MISVSKICMEGSLGLAARLREHASRIAGPGANSESHDPETFALENEAADAIEGLTKQRKAWKCTVGGEVFRTDDPEVAKDWAEGGMDVHFYFAEAQENGESAIRALENIAAGVIVSPEVFARETLARIRKVAG